jgi:hypothetical protein
MIRRGHGAGVSRLVSGPFGNNGKRKIMKAGTLLTPSGESDRVRGGVRAVATVEAAKGAVILLAGFGLLSLVHRSAQEVAEEIVGHMHLNPASRYPCIFIDLAGHLSDSRLWMLAGLAMTYSGLRFLEAYGLWSERGHLPALRNLRTAVRSVGAQADYVHGQRRRGGLYGLCAEAVERRDRERPTLKGPGSRPFGERSVRFAGPPDRHRAGLQTAVARPRVIADEASR